MVGVFCYLKNYEFVTIYGENISFA